MDLWTTTKTNIHFTKKELVFYLEKEPVKETICSDDNKPEFFETASHVSKNSGLFQELDA